jgi:hypothetical protein
MSAFNTPDVVMTDTFPATTEDTPMADRPDSLTAEDTPMLDLPASPIPTDTFMTDAPPPSPNLSDVLAALRALYAQHSASATTLADLERRCLRQSACVFELYKLNLAKDRDLDVLDREVKSLLEEVRGLREEKERDGRVMRGVVEDVDGEGDDWRESDGEGWKMITGGGEPGDVDVEVTELSLTPSK